jgi:inactivated superfamily I helicase
MAKWRTPQHRYFDPVKQEFPEDTAPPNREERLDYIRSIARIRVTQYVEKVLLLAFPAQAQELIRSAHAVIDTIDHDKLRKKTAETLARKIADRWATIVPIDSCHSTTIIAGLVTFVFNSGSVIRRQGPPPGRRQARRASDC